MPSTFKILASVFVFAALVNSPVMAKSHARHNALGNVHARHNAFGNAHARYNAFGNAYARSNAFGNAYASAARHPLHRAEQPPVYAERPLVYMDAGAVPTGGFDRQLVGRLPLPSEFQ